MPCPKCDTPREYNMAFDSNGDRIQEGYVCPCGHRDIIGRAQYDDNSHVIVRWLTCNGCGSTWNDAIISSYTPVPSGRCPWEGEHA